MILEDLKLIFGNEIRNNIINMYMANDEQNRLAKHSKEFKTKTKPQNILYLKKVKENVINSAIALLKGRKMVKALESRIFLKRKESEQSGHSSDDVKYNSFGCYTYKLSKKLKDVSLESVSSDADNRENKLFTPLKRRTGLRMKSIQI